jgi:uncharacterized protein (DUF736 family)
MDKQYDNNNTGVLWKNRKKTTDKHPDYTGTAEVDGVEYLQSAWLKTKKDGEKFLKISFTKKGAGYTKQAPKTQDDDAMGDDIPF